MQNTGPTKPRHQAPELPPHLQAVVDKLEAKRQRANWLDLSQLDPSKYDDDHPIHAMVGMHQEPDQ